MARPKGSLQKNRNENKYTLPNGVTLKQGQTALYNKETKLIFVDSEYGEFVSSFKALQLANASTHPLSIQNRRKITNLNKYGVENVGANEEVRKKASNTMIDRYGVSHALKSEQFLLKSKQTLLNNHGVTSPMQSEELKNKQKLTFIQKYGTDNPMKVKEIVNKLLTSNLQKYGVNNPMKTDEIKQRVMESLTYSDGIKKSKGELELKEYIDSLGFTTKSGFLGGKNPKQIDIMIDGFNVCFEYNGVFWHSEANGRDKNYHKEKTLKAESKGLELIQIFDFEWKERNSQIKSFIRSKLKKNEIIIYARKTEIKEVSKNEAIIFLNKYHILGSCRFKKAYGLYYNEELVSMITIGLHHRNNKEIVLSRYVGKENITVTGGLTKLCKHAKKIHGKLITWVDRRFSNSLGWQKAGWTKISDLSPDYFYYNQRNGQIVSKQARKKSIVKTPEGMTEKQHSLLDGLVRVYDCGKIKLMF